MEQDSIPFGAWLKRQRRASDLTHEELASRIGCGPITLHKIQTGQRRSSKQITEILAAKCSVPGCAEHCLDEAFGVVRPSEMFATAERIIESACGSLDAEASEAAWMQRRTVPIEQAIAEMLGEKP